MMIVNKQTGMDPIERLRFLASLPRAGAGHEKTQPFNWIPSHRVTLVDQKTLYRNAMWLISGGEIIA